jgi:small conductance mechanosensitive channel
MSFNFDNLQSLIVSFGLNILWVIVILVIGWWLAALIARLLRRTLGKVDVEPTLIGFLSNMTYYVLLTFVILAVLARLGIQTTSIIAVLGAAGLAVGLALQGALSNFAAGVLILFFRPYRVGDYVEIGGAAGTVEQIQIFNTILATPDRKTVIVPNAQATGGNIVNYTTKGTRRVDMVFGIGYEDDILKAKQLLETVLAEDERIFKDPAPTVAVLELADSSVNFAVRPYVKVEDYWSVLFDTTEKVKLLFDQQGVSIPYPQQDVHLIQPGPN